MSKPVVRTFVDNATDNGFQQDSGVVAATAQGNFYAIWRDSGNFNSGHSDIVGRPFDTLGNPSGGDVSLLPLNNAFGVPFNASRPATVALPISGQASGTATAFTDNFNNGPDFDVYVVRTNASLSRLENPLLIDGSTSVTNDPSVTSFADGSLVVSYTIQNSTTDWDILARTVSASGVVGPVITLFNDTDRSDLSDLATLKNGNFVAVFESPFLGSPTDLDSFFTIKTENGTNVVSPTTVVGAGSTATETDPHVAALAGGGFVVTWTDSAGDESGTSQGIRATVYDANGNLVPNAGDILVNQFNQAGTQQSNDVTALPDGGFEVAWEDIAAGVDRVQRFDAAGHLIGLPVTISNLATFDVNAATLTNERSIYTFNDFSSGNNNTASSILLNPQPSDFNGDGASDVLLQSGGTVVDWIMQNGVFQSGNVVTTGAAGFNVVGNDDFNGDGSSDVLLQSGGTVVDWIMHNGVFQSGNVVTTGAVGFNVVGTGDFNGDGTSDVLLQSGGTVVDWIMHNGVFQSGNVVTTGAAGFNVVGTGDFNGDGTSDVLLQSGGTVVDWIMHNGVFQSGNVVTTGATGFNVVGTGDFNGDGSSDVLLQSGGTVVDWIMKNGVFQSGNVITTGAAGFNVVGTGDFNGDGTSDILLQNGGTVVDWIMNHGEFQSGNVVTTGAAGFHVAKT